MSGGMSAIVARGGFPSAVRIDDQAYCDSSAARSRNLVPERREFRYRRFTPPGRHQQAAQLGFQMSEPVDVMLRAEPGGAHCVGRTHAKDEAVQKNLQARLILLIAARDADR
jgi:hypothetical protein